MSFAGSSSGRQINLYFVFRVPILSSSQRGKSCLDYPKVALTTGCIHLREYQIMKILQSITQTI
jgi:hypothetical protein